MQIKSGQLVRQIGYFENGNLNYDFRMIHGKKNGTSRMWRSDGSPYIEEYYNQSGKMDVNQQRCQAGRVLTREALFKNGNVIYDLCYDQDRNVIQQTGFKQWNTSLRNNLSIWMRNQCR